MPVLSNNHLSLKQCRFFILDEADGLLKAGYESLIKRLHNRLVQRKCYFIVLTQNTRKVVTLAASDATLSPLTYAGFFGHFEKNSRQIRKKLKQFIPKTQANLLRNSRICQPKANFFLTFSVLCENFPP